MLAVRVGSDRFVTGFDVMTLAAFGNRADLLEDPNVFYVDRSVFYLDSEVADFMSTPQKYYVDEDGVLRRDFGDYSNDVDFGEFADMYALARSLP